jgi:peptide/nickel transport system permease protein
MKAPLLRASYGFLGAVLFFAVFGNLLFAHAPESISACVAGIRSTVVVAAAVVALSFFIGVSAAGVAALGPPTCDVLLSRFVEIASALPSVVVVAVVASVARVSDVVSIATVLGVSRGLQCAKVIRAELLQLGAEDFVLAARAAGIGEARLFRTHFLPHVTAGALSTAVMGAGAVVGLDAAGSFLGVFPGAGSWGSVLAEAARRSSPALFIGPALGTALTVAALVVVSDSFAERTKVGRRLI